MKNSGTVGILAILCFIVSAIVKTDMLGIIATMLMCTYFIIDTLENNKKE